MVSPRFNVSSWFEAHIFLCLLFIFPGWLVKGKLLIDQVHSRTTTSTVALGLHGEQPHDFVFSIIKVKFLI